MRRRGIFWRDNLKTQQSEGSSEVYGGVGVYLGKDNLKIQPQRGDDWV